MFERRRRLQAYLRVFVSVVATLIIIGCVFIYSASSVFAQEQFGAAHYFMKKQAVGLLFGLIALFVMRIVPLSFVKRASPFIFLVLLLLSALTSLPCLSRTVHGASRWIRFGGFTLQPSEFLKNSFIVYLAYFFSKNINLRRSTTRLLIPVVFIFGLTAVVLMRQPDFGLTFVLALTSLSMLFFVGYPIKNLIFIGIGSVPLIAFLVFWKSYRLRRIITFLNPWSDPQGKGFQIIQSLIAVGSGGVWGSGVSNSSQKFFYLPMQHTDFIFSIIAEETGFVGGVILVIAYMLFLYFGLRISLELCDVFSIFALNTK